VLTLEVQSDAHPMSTFHVVVDTDMDSVVGTSGLARLLVVIWVAPSVAEASQCIVGTVRSHVDLMPKVLQSVHSHHQRADPFSTAFQHEARQVRQRTQPVWCWHGKGRERKVLEDPCQMVLEDTCQMVLAYSCQMGCPQSCRLVFVA